MAKDYKQITVNTYNQSAKALAEYFKSIGARTKDIEFAINLSNNPSGPSILEIGCGDGRDAKEIVLRASAYTGFDISEELIKLARKHVPNGDFKVADATTYNYPENKFDVVFAFASLLHLNKNEVKVVLDKVYKALKPGGIFFISLKYAQQYMEKIKQDQYGTRMFYFYNPDLIKHLTGNKYEVLSKGTGFITGGGTEWFEVALKKL